MIVELKKTKITSTIVKQSLRGSDSLMFDHEGYDVLGWCMMKYSNKYIREVLLYKSATNQIIKLPYVIPSDKYIKLESENRQVSDGEGGYIFPTYWMVKAYCIDLGRSFNVAGGPDEDKIITIHQAVTDFYSLVNKLGQIYI